MEDSRAARWKGRVVRHSGTNMQGALAGEGRVLVAYVPHRRDLEIAERQGWYRIRSREMADRLRGGLHSFSYLAFYQPLSFVGEQFCIRRYAHITGISEARRVELLPEEPNHPRAQQLYYRLGLGPMRLLPSPVLSERHRRILFIPTTWERLAEAREINELFIGSPLEERLYSRLRDLGLSPEREYYVTCADPTKPKRPPRSFSLDFALFCRDRQLAIETDGDTWHTGPEKSAADNERDNLLEANLWHVLRFSTAQIEENMAAVLSVIREAVNKYGGVKDTRGIVRLFSPDGRLAPGQGTLGL